jgi:DNA repair protein RecN (Recombination protein N)
MLKRLRVQGFALLSDVTLEFTPGLNVLTGETGAGKSLVLGALSALLGKPSAASSLGAGRSAQIELEIGPDHAAVASRALLVAEGPRLRASIDGRKVPLSELRAWTASGLIMTAQGSIRELASPAGVLGLLDQRAGAAGLLSEYRGSRASLLRLRDELRELSAEQAQHVARGGRLGELLDELGVLAPRAGEYAALLSRIELVSRRTQYLELCGRVLDVISERDNSVESDLKALMVATRRAASGVFAELTDRLGEALACLASAANRATHTALELEAEPAELAELEVRRNDFERLAARVGCAPEELSEAATRLELERAHLEALEARLTELESERARVEAEARAQSEMLHDLRARAVQGLEKELLRELAMLSLEGARLDVKVERRSDPLGPDGGSLVRLGFSANIGQPLQALERVASGGERSRFALALACVGAAQGRTLVFDEIDQGGGGEALSRLAERLTLLSRSRQILCVTHQAAIAARAESHLRVQKALHAGVTRTTVSRLDEEARTLELSRMLAGGKASDGARSLARRLRAEGRSAA